MDAERIWNDTHVHIWDASSSIYYNPPTECRQLMPLFLTKALPEGSNLLVPAGLTVCGMANDNTYLSLFRDAGLGCQGVCMVQNQ
jgi:hypothetical protein